MVELAEAPQYFDRGKRRKVRMIQHPASKTAVVFAGGLGLAAYQAGAYEALNANGVQPAWVSGSSAGAVTAAIIAGNSPEDRVSRLRSFWNLDGADASFDYPWEHMQGWMSAISAHIFGSVGFFHPRLPSFYPLGFRSLYDLAPMKSRLNRLIDFDRLNSGEVRVSIAATDVETGHPVLFDSNTDPIEMDHLMASCGFLPEFSPVEIGGRLLADGGLSINAPFDPILETEDETFSLFIIDLFARDGDRPRTLEAAAERKNDLMFANQTVLRLQDKLQIRQLRRELAGTRAPSDQVFLLSYRAGADEPGPEKSYNFSRHGRALRWSCGRLDMLQALDECRSTGEGLYFIRRPEITAPRSLKVPQPDGAAADLSPHDLHWLERNRPHCPASGKPGRRGR